MSLLFFYHFFYQRIALFWRGKEPTEVYFYECPKPSKLTVRTLWSLYTAVLRADVALLSFGIKYSLASFQAKNYLST